MNIKECYHLAPGAWHVAMLHRLGLGDQNFRAVAMAMAISVLCNHGWRHHFEQNFLFVCILYNPVTVASYCRQQFSQSWLKVSRTEYWHFWQFRVVVPTLLSCNKHLNSLYFIWQNRLEIVELQYILVIVWVLGISHQCFVSVSGQVGASELPNGTYTVTNVKDRKHSQRPRRRASSNLHTSNAVSYTHLTLPTIYSV